jgi:hypothetical protein
MKAMPSFLRSRMAFSRRLIVAIASALALAGCDGNGDRVETFPASGQVLWEGKPLAGALVVLHPLAVADGQALPARAETDEQGKFVLGTYDSEDGVAPGDYVVTVHWHALVKNGESYEPGPDVVPAQFSNRVQSSLKARIAAGENQLLPFQLRR